jgi:hypothetical protein
MAIKSWPYVSIDGDRKITAADFAQGYDLISASGVVPGFLNALAPSKVSGTLNVNVDTGAALVGGRWYVQDSAEQIALDAGDSQPRIDIIAVESNSNTPVRASQLVIIKGTPAASPVAPALTNTSAISQIELCRVLVPADATTLSNATLTDTRTYVDGRHAHDLEDITGLQEALNGKAASSHNHSASDITSGTLPIARGGTGATSAAAAREALGAEAVLSSDRKRKITISTSNPSGGTDGDVWIKYS